MSAEHTQVSHQNDFNMDWSSVCRVCLQEGGMKSILEKDDIGVTISDKIMECSVIKITPGTNLPEHICFSCLGDLDTAWRFRNNCESSEAILFSLVDGNGGAFKFKPLPGSKLFKVKAIEPVTVKSEPEIELYTVDEKTEITLDYSYERGIAEPNEVEFEQQNIDSNVDYPEACGDFQIAEEIGTPSLENRENICISIIGVGRQKLSESYEITNMQDGFEMRPITLNMKKRKKPCLTEKLKVVSSDSIKMRSNGTTVIRVPRTKCNSDDNKPLKVCEVCGNTYKYKHVLESHMRRHRNEKPFGCEICGRSFVINFELRRHMRTHTGQKPYACQFCGRKFSDFGSRIKHERTHTGERPYTCETCGKSFSYSHVLSGHILTHTGEKRFGCEKCGKRFAKSHHLKAHMNIHSKERNKEIESKTELADDLSSLMGSPSMHSCDS